MPFLLDTNSWINYLKRADSPVGVRLRSLQPNEIVVCSIVRAELFHGAEKYGNRERRITTVTQTLAPFRSYAFDDESAQIYASIRHVLELTGTTIGPYDLQIAAICLQHQLTLVTDNTSEFERVEQLHVENWLRTT